MIEVKTEGIDTIQDTFNDYGYNYENSLSHSFLISKYSGILLENMQSIVFKENNTELYRINANIKALTSNGVKLYNLFSLPDFELSLVVITFVSILLIQRKKLKI